MHRGLALQVPQATMTLPRGCLAQASSKDRSWDQGSSIWCIRRRTITPDTHPTHPSFQE